MSQSHQVLTVMAMVLASATGKESIIGALIVPLTARVPVVPNWKTFPALELPKTILLLAVMETSPEPPVLAVRLEAFTPTFIFPDVDVSAIVGATIVGI